uniref:FAD-binding domain-containing protein n=1 Tax=Chromera velia CCMP2878 TaxID=1169474 RepID=A0A0G4H6P7_9ALVE|mmetsp:Transcript_49121/g.96845  ORF Transcript_49121/g.96845 Transcript_49121/m.96845 type:complete len:584 (+) Transcript_49121:208-1959(+)|eukprot:Cvel_5768.t1-p1 / transcript=Cvel_5768.t1 / gene=Cvel_5768 / organism=Chromera_velia_CCMP2878 / gene_product=Zeaxanthin epoxidase, chloroplastic, putative / transcript_product=Zeaxanthin epoxidase, chloroplastic, putative / location=Cvel_scaffold274:27217-28965(-) / protein_length=583 / sequence_SO=supercontig / SO=protein_coding / is_pseudo=false
MRTATVLCGIASVFLSGSPYVRGFGLSSGVSRQPRAARRKGFSVQQQQQQQQGVLEREGIESSRGDAAPLRVAIAGGGVGGLAAAVVLAKKGFDVKVYEKTDSFKRFGGPIQLASNALSVLKAIDDQLFRDVISKFTFTATRTCGIKDGLRARDFKMNDTPDWFVKFSAMKGAAEHFGLPYTGVIDRPDLQDVLIETLSRTEKERGLKEPILVNSEKVVAYEDGEDGVTVRLASGATQKADILIGADGIWSAVRTQMYSETPDSDSRSETRQGCKYSGYTCFAGETVLPVPDYFDTGYKVYIGPGRYFVTSDVGDGRIQWYAFLALPPGTKKTGNAWNTNNDARVRSGEETAANAYISEMFEGWSPEIHHVLSHTPESAIEQRDLYDRAPEMMRSWTDGRVSLMGDAAHPMMPNLGQGGCQAMEDAYVLGEVLGEVTEGREGRQLDREEISEALGEYYRRRIVRSAVVQGLSRMASDLIINAFDTPYCPESNDCYGKGFKGRLTAFLRPFLQHIIFPLQFLYLYSFCPTGNMGGLPSQLVDTWLSRHKKSSSEAFQKAKKAVKDSRVTRTFFALAEKDGAAAA